MSPAATPRRTPPESGFDLVRRLEVLRDSGRPVKPKQVESSFRSKVNFSVSEDQLDRIADLLDEIDPTWGCRLAIVFRQLPKRDSFATRDLTARITSDARARVNFPRDAGSDAEIEQWTMAWLDQAARGYGMGLQPAMLAVALWPDRSASHYPAALVQLIARTADMTLTRLDLAGLEKSTADLILLGKGVKARARSALVFAQQVEAARLAAYRERDELTRSRDTWKDRAIAAEQAQEDLFEQVRTADARAAEAESTLDMAQQAAINENRSLRTKSDNELGRLRGHVLAVLDLETNQIRSYLDRPSPNTTDALARLGHLERLADELRGMS